MVLPVTMLEAAVLRRARRLLAGLVLAAAVGQLCVPAGATAIEGYTPSGKFRTVGVTEDGRFQVATSTGLAQHVIVDTGTVTVNTLPGTTINVSGPGGGPISVAGGFSVSASTSSTLVTGCATMNGASAVVIYPADPARKQGFVYNTSSTDTAFFGPDNATDSTSPPLPPGASIQPDNPSSFINEIWGFGPNGVKLCYAYFK